MLRTIIWFIYFWLYQIIALPNLLRANRLAAKGMLAERDALAARQALGWSRSLLWLAGCRVQVTGAEQIPEGAVVYVSNHQGAFDIPILLGSIEKPKGFIAKDSLEKMPGVGHWMQHIHCVFIKRGNPREAIVAISQGVQKLKEGHSMVIFPEGTRSKDGALLEFKAGALKLATKAGVPIVPVAIDGSVAMMQKGSWVIHPADVAVTVFPPFLPETYKDLDTNELTEQLKQTIASVLPMEKERMIP